MSDMKCPFCQQEIKIAGEHTTIMSCFNGDCKGSGLYGEKAFWQELICTRKELEVAKDAIDVISLKYHKDTPSVFLIKYAQNAKAEITALEQGGNNDSNS